MWDEVWDDCSPRRATAGGGADEEASAGDSPRSLIEARAEALDHIDEFGVQRPSGTEGVRSAAPKKDRKLDRQAARERKTTISKPLADRSKVHPFFDGRL